mgnify:CR=1
MDLHSGAPFWLVRNGLGRSHAPPQRDERCDIAARIIRDIVSGTPNDDAVIFRLDR